MKLLFALPGFHLVDRGAEVALLAVAEELARAGDAVTVMGSGPERPGKPYRYVRIPSVRRERWENVPKFPPVRSETAWEDATFTAGLIWKSKLRDYDATVTCSFPFTHWGLRRKGPAGPAHVFVTQNGDWPACHNDAEFRTFNCDGLVCTNPDYFERNKDQWRCALIPNGVDLDRFKPGHADRAKMPFSTTGPVILMVSALIESKRVLDGIRAVAALERAQLVVAGDGPLREDVTKLADQLLPGRFSRVSLTADEMPDLYRAADVFLHLSLLESFGNVFLEAWGTGLPVVAHDTDRLRWILGNHHYLCDTTDPAALRGALLSALSSNGAHPREGVERFSWSAIGAEYRNFLKEVIAIRQLDS